MDVILGISMVVNLHWDFNMISDSVFPICARHAVIYCTVLHLSSSSPEFTSCRWWTYIIYKLTITTIIMHRKIYCDTIAPLNKSKGALLIYQDVAVMLMLLLQTQCCYYVFYWLFFYSWKLLKRPDFLAGWPH